MAPANSDSDTRSASRPLLSVRALTVSYRVHGSSSSPVPAIADVSLDLSRGESVGIFGESGCGKSTLLLSIVNLLPEDATTSGSVVFGERNLLKEDERTLQSVRGAQIGTVVQEAGTALNPVRRVGDQVAEVLQAHANVSRQEASEAARATLRRVGLGDERFYRSWPHTLSGGQQQRVLIAQALICTPALLLADEPTHALDAGTRQEITALFQALHTDSGTALVIASHDPAVLQTATKRLLVFYAGQLIESGQTDEIFSNPLHPYTRALVDCFPVEPRRRGEERNRLRAIPGATPESNGDTGGCRFASRCAHRRPACSESRPELRSVTANREVRCFLYGNQTAS